MVGRGVMALGRHPQRLNLRLAAAMRVQNHRFGRDTHRYGVTDLLDEISDDGGR